MHNHFLVVNCFKSTLVKFFFTLQNLCNGLSVQELIKTLNLQKKWLRRKHNEILGYWLAEDFFL